jgi:hypothetical protein
VDAVLANVAIAGAGDHSQGGGLAGLGGIDLGDERAQAAGAFFDPPRSELDLERCPATVVGLDDGIDLDALVVAVLLDTTIERLCVDAQVLRQFKIAEPGPAAPADLLDPACRRPSAARDSRSRAPAAIRR